MDLILWRHAQAEILEDALQCDDERKLTLKGQKQAAKMALWLDSVLPHSCRILVGPSQRTMQTALALGRKFKVMEDIGTAGSVDRIITASNWPNSRESVLIVGHQPHLGNLVCRLLPSISDCAMRKGNVWWISLKEGEENAQPYLKAVMTPELVVK